MSVQAMSWVFDHSDSKLASRLVLLSIANHADRCGRNSFPSYETIAKDAHCSRRQAIRAVADLVELGEVGIEAQPSPYGTNMYTLALMVTGDNMSLGAGDNMSPAVVTNPTAGGDEMSPEPSSTKPSTEVPHFVRSFVAHFVELLEAEGSKIPGSLRAWHTEVDRMFRLDSRDPEEATAVLDWAKADPFWRANILSPAKFRKQYDQLRLHRDRGSAARSADAEGRARLEAWAQEEGEQ